MMYQSNITFNSITTIVFAANFAASSGGAVCMDDSSNLFITGGATVYFLNNKTLYGGAILVHLSQIFIQMFSFLLVGNNSALSHGGGTLVHSGSVNVSEHSEVNFTANVAQMQGGALYQSLAGLLSVESCSKLMLSNNSASQGGSLYLSASATVNIGNDSVLLFINNTALDCGGAVYASDQFGTPCFLVLLSYSSVVIFQGNTAKSGIDVDIYGAIIRSSKCAQYSKQTNTLSYCGNELKANIIFIPSNHNSSLISNSVSSDPKQVYLCDSHGSPQCANLSKIFVIGPRLYSGEPFNH